MLPSPQSQTLRGRRLLGRTPGNVHRMLGKQAHALAHQVRKQIAARPAGIVVQHRLVGQIVGRGGAGIGREGRRPARAAVHHQVAIAHARVKLEFRAAELFLGGFHERGRLGRGDLPGRKALHHLVFDGDQIAADGPIGRAEFDSLRGRFQGRPAGEMRERVVAQQAQVGRIRARRQGLGRMIGAAQESGRGHGVHGRNMGRLQRRLAAERLLRLVGTTVGNDDGEFHGRGVRDQGSGIRGLGGNSRRLTAAAASLWIRCSG